MSTFSNKKPKYFWDVIDKPYQMGSQKHRVYLLDLLKQKGIAEILDVGCGTGPIYELIKDTAVQTDDGTTYFKKWDFKYKGTDYSEDMIACCKHEFPEGDFEIEDARKLKEKDDSWDCVLLLHALDHVKQYDEVIKEAARVAKRYVCIVLWRQFSPEGVQINDRNTLGKKEGEEPWEDTYLMQYSKEALGKEFEKNGLGIMGTAEGEDLNSDHSKWNYLFLLKK
jgi:ubiquinone/menaquinone biosynthesis C-methylase UbiE